MFCKNCGSKLVAKTKFCSECGTSIQVGGDVISDSHRTGLTNKYVKILVYFLGFFLAFGLFYFLANTFSVMLLGSGGYSAAPISSPHEPIAIKPPPSSEWEELNSPIGFFKIMMPSHPKTESIDNKLPNSSKTFKSYSYTSELKNGTAFMVEVAIYPKEVNISKPANNFKNALDGIVGSVDGNRLISSSSADYAGNKAMDFMIQNKDFLMKGRLVLADRTLYQLTMVYDEKNYIDANYNKFIDSFQLIEL
jgi:hypothetical protein